MIKEKDAVVITPLGLDWINSLFVVWMGIEPPNPPWALNRSGVDSNIWKTTFLLVWPTGDGRIRANQLRLVVYPCLSHYLQGFIHPRWCRISSINSMTYVHGYVGFRESNPVFSFCVSMSLVRDGIDFSQPSLALFKSCPPTKCSPLGLVQKKNTSRTWSYNSWVVVSNIFYFHPYLGRWSNLTSIFFKWLETTN